MIRSVGAGLTISWRGGRQLLELLQLQPSVSRFDLVEATLCVADLKKTDFATCTAIRDEDASEDHIIILGGSLRPVTATVYELLVQARSDGFSYVYSAALCNEYGTGALLSRGPSPMISMAAISHYAKPSPYVYDSLISKTHFRLIEFVPELELAGREQSRMQIRLSQVNVDEASDYTLIRKSGSHPDTTSSWPARVQILCNDQLLEIPLPIKENLKLLRDAKVKRVWIEHICVDQTSANDKEHHIQIFPYIRDMAEHDQGQQTYGVDMLPLSENQQEIRLLRILPPRADAHDKTLVVTDFELHPLEKAPAYVALSYAWGHRDPKTCVYLPHGQPVDVTWNLHSALVALRDNGHNIVWADALCINQDDVRERSHQVLNMRSIYQKADRVIVVPGPSFHWFPELKHSIAGPALKALIAILSNTAKTLQAIRPAQPQVYPDEERSFGLPPRSHSSWAAFEFMLGQAWFGRAWIVQEVTAGKAVDIHWSGCVFSWEDIRLASRAVQLHQVDSLSKFRGLINVQAISRLQELTGENKVALLDVVCAFRIMDATDSRDKIYAFRGIADDAHQSPLPDYSSSTEDIYIQYARFFVGQGRGIQVLREAGTARSDHPTLPSWVPDWSCTMDWQSHNFHKDPFFQVGFESLRDTGTSPGGSCKLGDSNTLLVEGVILDRVDKIGNSTLQCWPRLERSKIVLPSEQAFWDDASRIALSSPLSSQNKDDGSDHITRLNAAMSAESAQSHNQPSVFFERTGSEIPALSIQDFQYLHENLHNRKICVSVRGYIGLVPAETHEGDFVGCFWGAKASVILRRSEKYDDAFILIGDAYFDDLLNFGLTKEDDEFRAKLSMAIRLV